MHTALAELTADSEKYRSQAIHNQKATQAEVMKNNDLVKQSKQAEHILGVRMNQGEEGRKEIHCLNEENVNLEKINDQLELDLEACRRHLDNLNMLNNQVKFVANIVGKESRRVFWRRWNSASSYWQERKSGLYEKQSRWSQFNDGCFGEVDIQDRSNDGKSKKFQILREFNIFMMPNIFLI